MSAFVRLWSRAPLWRRGLFATAAAVAMTIAFPPAWIGGGVTVSPPRATPVVESPPAMPERPESSPVVRANDPSLPVAGTFYSGHLQLGAQSVPLPPGRWIALAVSSPAGSSSTNVFLALMLGGRISAAAVIGGSTAPDQKDGGYPAPLEAQVPSFYYRRVFSAIDHGALDFWVCGITQPDHWNDAVRQAAVGVVRQQGMVFPDRLDSVVFRFADKRNWISADFMFPDPAGTTELIRPWIEAATLSDTGSLSYLEKVRRWGKAWHEIMRGGFAGTLHPGDEAHIAPP